VKLSLSGLECVCFVALGSDFSNLRSGWSEEVFPRLSDEKWRAIEEYGRLLYLWSGKINLLSRSERNLIATKHIWRGIALAKAIEARAPQTIVDIGSGAGIPALPIKIFLPDTEIFLVESRRKRANFLRAVTRALSLKKICVINERIENWDSAVKADIVTARAVANPSVLLNWITDHVYKRTILVCTLSSECGYAKNRNTEIKCLTWAGQSMRVGLFPVDYQHQE
tara:strand:- start:894 stop:1568 length:675 start_codon:yes stop_codon:yes gene_type:complete